MTECPHCRRTVEASFSYCPGCGKNLYPSAATDTKEISEEEIRTFIGKNADYYLRKFRAFRASGQEGFAFTWHWPAFFTGFVWMLYRKLYLWAFIAFLLILTPISFPLLMVGWGLTGNYLYYRMVRQKILEYKKVGDPRTSDKDLGQKGGVNRWVWWLGLLLLLLLAVMSTLGLCFVFFLLKTLFFHGPGFIQI